MLEIQRKEKAWICSLAGKESSRRMKKGVSEPVVDGCVVHPFPHQPQKPGWPLVWLFLSGLRGHEGTRPGFNWPSGFQFLCYFG